MTHHPTLGFARIRPDGEVVIGPIRPLFPGSPVVSAPRTR